MDRAMRCPASRLLPRVDSQPGLPAKHGLAIHKYLENVLERKQDPLEGVDEEFHEACKVIDHTTLPTNQPESFLGEATISWQPEKDETIFQPRERPPNSQLMRLDVLAVAQEERKGFLRDYKTGRGWLPPLKENWQLKNMAVVMAKHFDLLSVDAGIVFVHGEDSYEASTVWDLFDLSLFEEDILALFEKLRAFQAAFPIARDDSAKAVELLQKERAEWYQHLPISIGPWCNYCPAWQHCPGQMKMVHAVAADPEAVAERMVAGCTAAEISTVDQRLTAIYAALKRVKLAIDDWTRQYGPFQRANGKLYGPHTPNPRDVVQGPVAFQVLSNTFGEEIARKASDEIRITKASIGRALRTIADEQKVPRSKLNKEVIEKIRAAGGILKSKPKSKVDEYKA